MKVLSQLCKPTNQSDVGIFLPPLEITVEPPVSDHPKRKDLVVTYGRWSLTRIEPQEASSEKSSRHIYFMEDIYCMQSGALNENIVQNHLNVAF